MATAVLLPALLVAAGSSVPLHNEMHPDQVRDCRLVRPAQVISAWATARSREG